MAEEKEQEPEPMRRKGSRARRTAELAAGGGSGGEESADSGVIETVADVEAPAADEPSHDGADDAALEYWRDAVLRDPLNVPARLGLARVFELRGDELLSVEQLEAARTVQPENLELIVRLANANIALRRFDDAERDLRRTLRFQTDHADVHLALGVISFRRGLYLQAEQELRRALDLNPESASAYFYRGEALNNLSRVDEALDMLLRATQLQPDNARAFFVMGILYDKKSRSQEAAAMYRKAREAGAA
ncbi:MAG: tetratricopeptide repeat protein [Gemmatimonadetes bacterium]|nr:tetratricopeptide repeat protein [Gemmatimonadota bacterium]